jgi:DNA repair exonuclease SbcCD nuclease subunit
MKILHTADLHIREYEDDRWKTLQKLIETGKKEKVEIFVISGDLFDKDVDAENLRPKIRNIFSKNGFKIVLLPGNHDCNSYKRGMYFGEDTTILSDLGTPFEWKDIRIWGMPFETIEGKNILIKLHSLANKLTPDKKNILLYHGELLDAFFSRRDFGEEGEERYMPAKLSYFKDLNIDYVLAGHFHFQPEARIILIIKGYINGKEMEISESEMVSQIKEIIHEKCIEEQYEFKDIQTILEDDLFKKFKGKLSESEYDEEKKKSIQEIAIKSMMEAK